MVLVWYHPSADQTDTLAGVIKMDNITIRIDADGDAIAFIHDAPVNDDMVLSYQHIGQHGEASLDYMWDCFHVLTPQDVIKAYELVKELKSIGYDVN